MSNFNTSFQNLIQQEIAKYFEDHKLFNPDNDTTTWMNKSKTAEYLDVCINTLNKWIEFKNCPVHCVHGKYLASSNEIDEWVKAQSI